MHCIAGEDAHTAPGPMSNPQHVQRQKCAFKCILFFCLIPPAAINYSLIAVYKKKNPVVLEIICDKPNIIKWDVNYDPIKHIINKLCVSLQRSHMHFYAYFFGVFTSFKVEVDLTASLFALVCIHAHAFGEPVTSNRNTARTWMYFITLKAKIHSQSKSRFGIFPELNLERHH